MHKNDWVLLEENISINATEVLGVCLAMDICGIYKRIIGKTDKYPGSHISHSLKIIFDKKNHICIIGL
jgi:hypothetical protein